MRAAYDCFREGGDPRDILAAGNPSKPQDEFYANLVGYGQSQYS